jgi:hypothetical protein
MTADDFRKPTFAIVPWAAWFFVALHLFLLDGLVLRLGLPLPDLAVVFCLFAAVAARSSALPGLLICAALGRSVFVEGGLGAQILVLGIPIAILLPLRLVFFRRNFLWQAIVAGFLAWSLPRLEVFVGRFADASTVVTPVTSLPFVAMVAGPPLAWLLGRLPPTSTFVERVE